MGAVRDAAVDHADGAFRRSDRILPSVTQRRRRLRRTGDCHLHRLLAHLLAGVPAHCGSSAEEHPARRLTSYVLVSRGLLLQRRGLPAQGTQSEDPRHARVLQGL